MKFRRLMLGSFAVVLLGAMVLPANAAMGHPHHRHHRSHAQ